MSKDSRFFELLDHVGVEPSHIVKKKDKLTGEVLEEAPHPNAGELGPLVHFTAHVAVPIIVDGELVKSVQAIEVEPAEKLDEAHQSRIVPGQRVIETRDPNVAAAIVERGDFREIDPPKSEQTRRPKDAPDTTPAGEEKE